VAHIDLIGWLMRVENVMDLDHLATSLQLNERPVTIKGKWHWPDQEVRKVVESL
jgi:hypothetical protein